VILLATGSEVSLVVAAADALAGNGIRARVVSMPAGSCSKSSQRPIAPRCCRRPSPGRLAVEAGVSLGWHRWTGPSGATHTLDRYAASAPGEQLFTRFGFAVEQMVERVRTLMA
jgi:transketolase